jgi:hypothetical protein
MNVPNGGPGGNGEGDAALMLYAAGFFIGGDLIGGINVEVWDWNLGANTLKYKALEMRYENPLAGTAGLPDWTTAGLVDFVSPVPYISNFPNLNQYGFTAAPFPAPTALNTMAVVQYTPGQNIATTGCPLVGRDNDGNSGWSYAYDANAGTTGLLAVSTGPCDWVLCLYGNPVPPTADIQMNLFNQRAVPKATSKTAIVPGAGLDMVITLLNTTGVNYACTVSFWGRMGVAGYSGSSGTGVDIVGVLTGYSQSSPYAYTIPPLPPTGYTVKYNLTPQLGQMMEFGFSALTIESYNTGGSPPVTNTHIHDAAINPAGVEDDNSIETHYYINNPASPGDGWAKRFQDDVLPAVPWTLHQVGWIPWDLAGNGNALLQADVRLEGTFGKGTPDIAGGLLGTMNPATGGPGTLLFANVWDTVGNPFISFAGTPQTNFYTMGIINGNNVDHVAFGASNAGWFHKVFQDTSTSDGSQSGGVIQQPFGIHTSQLIVRLVHTVPLDTEPGSGDGLVSSAKPTFELAQ